jgi:hypothetical protein
MGIGTPRYLPLGITTENRWGAARRRRLVAICALCALAVAGFVIAEKAHDLMVMKSADAPAVGVSSGSKAPIEPRSVQPPTEAPNLAAKATEPTTVPVSAPSSPGAAAPIEPASMPAPAAAEPEPPSLPTVLRGAGIKPR